MPASRARTLTMALVAAVALAFTGVRLLRDEVSPAPLKRSEQSGRTSESPTAPATTRTDKPVFERREVDDAAVISGAHPSDDEKRTGDWTNSPLYNDVARHLPADLPPETRDRLLELMLELGAQPNDDMKAALDRVGPLETREDLVDYFSEAQGVDKAELEALFEQMNEAPEGNAPRQ